MIGGNLADLINNLDLPEVRKFLRPAKALEELKALYYLATIKDLHQRRLADKIGISLGQVNEVLSRLKRKHYLSVYGADIQHVVYELTLAGEVHLNSEMQQLKEVLKSLRIQAQEQANPEAQEGKPQEIYRE